MTAHICKGFSGLEVSLDAKVHATFHLISCTSEYTHLLRNPKTVRERVVGRQDGVRAESEDMRIYIQISITGDTEPLRWV